MPEVRRLLLAREAPPERQRHLLAWSHFRRRHQAHAGRAHTARRARRLPRLPEVGALPTGDGEAHEAGVILALAGTAVLTGGSWEQIHPLLPPLRGETGRPRHEHRRLLEGILWVMRSGHAWRDLPARYGPWQTAYHRLRQWHHEGRWESICRILHPDADRSPFSP